MRSVHLLALAALAVSVEALAQPEPGSFEQTWTKGPAWLQDAVIYQVYPSSYQDSDGNGIGDIPGVISRLDYIRSLGVNAIWFNPLFESGWNDGGYDIIDFYKVDPRFGTNSDLVELVRQAHERGLKVLLDLVAGHTSDKHPWFIQSSEGENLRYSDYYIWSDRLPDKKAEQLYEEMMSSPDPLRNTRGSWMSSTAPRGKFYNKNFYAGQPALNYGYAHPSPDRPWEQPVDAPGPRAVKNELKNIISFWYDKGVDGFRVDMAHSLVKNDDDKAETIKLWREIREWSDIHYPDHVLMAEWGIPQYCLAAGFNIDMCLNGSGTTVRRMYFDHKHQADGGSYFSLNGGQPSLKDLYGNPWPEEKIDRKATPAEMLKSWYDHYTEAVEWTRDWGYYATASSNHDHLRMNLGGRNTPEQLKVMMAWFMTMPLPILYYGDEIGMRSLVDLPNVEGANYNGKERAGARTPMQWDGSLNAGFSTCAPDKLYLPVCPEWTPATSLPQYLEWKRNGSPNPTAKGMVTVESQEQDPASLLNWTRALIRLRHAHSALWADSDFIPVFDAEHPYPMVYKRTDGTKTILVALNPTGMKQTLLLPADIVPGKESPILLSAGTCSVKATAKGARLTMSPTSVLIIEL